MRPQPLKATQQQTKAHNSQLVLRTIYDQAQISRADVARLTHLTRTTVSELVTELQERGLVEEVGQGQSGGGRTPILLSLVPDARHVIAVDLEDGEFRGAIVNLRNEIVRRAAVPFGQASGDEALQLVYQMLDSLLADTDRPILGIGIATPGLIDTPNGVIVRAVNLEWQQLPLGSLLQERYRVPVYVANDSQLAALAIYMAGEAEAGSLVAIKCGQGIGAGLVLNGQLFQGDGGGAGEIGHVAVREDGELCRCGNRGCLETVANDQAIIERARELGLVQQEILPPYWQDEYPSALAPVAEAVRAGNPAALQLVQEVGRYLGISIANLIGAINVRRVVLLGTPTLLGEPLLQAIKQEVARRALPVLTQDTIIEFGPANPDVVLLGSSALLLMHELGLGLAR